MWGNCPMHNGTLSILKTRLIELHPGYLQRMKLYSNTIIQQILLNICIYSYFMVLTSLFFQLFLNYLYFQYFQIVIYQKYGKCWKILIDIYNVSQSPCNPDIILNL